MTVSARQLYILETDVPPAPIAGAFGSYGDMLVDLLGDAGLPLTSDTTTTTTGSAAAGGAVEVIKVNVVDQPHNIPDLAVLHSQAQSGSGSVTVLITGSKHDAFPSPTHGKVDWIEQLVAFTRQAAQTEGVIRLIGVCFGHQVVGRALGAGVGVSPGGWEVGVSQVDLTWAGQALFNTSDASAGKLSLMQFHRDAVLDLPEDGETLLLAKSQQCPVQALYRPNKVLTFQGHPEFRPAVAQALLDAREDLVGPELAKQWEKEGTVAAGGGKGVEGNDGLVVGKVMARFVIGEI